MSASDWERGVPPLGGTDDDDPLPPQPPELLPLMEYPLLTGGTWGRELAMRCATAIYCATLTAAPQIALSITDLFDDAHRIETWLDRPDDDNPTDTVVTPCQVCGAAGAAAYCPSCGAPQERDV